jgi:MFS family permease
MRLAIFFGQAGVFPLYLLGLVAGLASGAAMLLYTVIKEVNPPQFGGTATGVITFLNFTFTPLFGPVFGGLLHHISGGAQRELAHYQAAFLPFLWCCGRHRSLFSAEKNRTWGSTQSCKVMR